LLLFSKLQAQAVELLCRCDDIADDGVELRVLKGLLTAVTSNTLHIHGQALLLVRVQQPAANSSPVPADAGKGVHHVQKPPPPPPPGRAVLQSAYSTTWAAVYWQPLRVVPYLLSIFSNKQ